jgi:tetratricopeptide (TPR) repeat protein
VPASAPAKLSAESLYNQGLAAFSKGDYAWAGRALSQLAPFDVNASDYSLPARYLLGRVHQFSGERTEALTHFAAVAADFPAARKRASELLRGKVSAEQQKYYEMLVRTTPEYVTRASLYSGEILLQSGKNAAAQDLLVKVQRETKDAAILDEAKFFQGVCQLQAGNYGEAEKLLGSLSSHKAFGDQARWWAARARALAADPAGNSYSKTITDAAEEMLSAAGVAETLAAGGDREANLRRAEILLDAGDTFILAKQFVKASEVYAGVAKSFAAGAPDKAEQAMERQVTALHLAEKYAESDEVAAGFEKTYPKSTLTAAVMFRTAENAYMRALAANGESAKNLFTAAAVKYQWVVAKYPDFNLSNAARGGLGTCQYQLGQYTAAAETLSKIPDAERVGELASVNYLLGDCLLRGLPAEADDAITASELLDDGGKAAKFFVNFAAANERHPAFADALLKAALCYERIGSVLANPMERGKALVSAKEMLDRAVNTLATRRSTPASAAKDANDFGNALMQRARVYALNGDMNTAVNDLRLFLRNEKLKDSPDTPLAVTRLAVYLRAAGRPGEAVDLLAQTRTKLGEESPLSAGLACEHAAALKEMGKLVEARSVFEMLAKKHPKTAEGATAAWRLLQIEREEAIAKLAAAKKANAPAPAVDEIYAALRKSAAGAIETGKAVLAFDADAASRLYYEAAWLARMAADFEIEKLSPKKIKEIPEQPGETQAFLLYQKAIDASPESMLAARARYDVADLWIRRGEHEVAIDHLCDALAQGPDLAMAERIRVRIAGSLLARGDANSLNAARAYLKPVAANNSSACRGEALYFTAESFAVQENWQSVVDTLVIFRVNGFTEIKGISDRAFWRLAQGQKEIGKPDDARQTLEQFVGKYSDNAKADEARFELASAYVKMKKPDAALAMYAEIIRRNVSLPLVSKAQLATGLIKLEQKNYQDATAVLVALKPKDDPVLLADAKKALARVVKDAPGTPWSAAAEKKLSELQ